MNAMMTTKHDDVSMTINMIYTTMISNQYLSMSSSVFYSEFYYKYQIYYKRKLRYPRWFMTKY